MTLGRPGPESKYKELQRCHIGPVIIKADRSLLAYGLPDDRPREHLVIEHEIEH